MGGRGDCWGGGAVCGLLVRVWCFNLVRLIGNPLMLMCPRTATNCTPIQGRDGVRLMADPVEPCDERGPLVGIVYR